MTMKPLYRLSIFLCVACVAVWLLRASTYWPVAQGMFDRQSADERLLDGLRMHDPEAVELALADGASPDATESFCLHTALMIAALNGDASIVRELLARGASIHQRDRGGWTALSHAAHTGKTTEAVRVLIESGDGEHYWNTVGASTDIIEASWLALADSLEYFLVKRAGWVPG